MIHRRMNTALFALALGPFAYYAKSANGRHFACTWVKGNGDPASQGFEKWCDAPKGLQQSTGQTVYECTGPHQTVPNHRVADWNVFRDKQGTKNVLEFGTPCGTGGYGSQDHDQSGYSQCAGYAWALCPAGANPKCRFMDAYDDCAWYPPFDTPPPSVSIWFKFRRDDADEKEE